MRGMLIPWRRNAATTASSVMPAIWPATRLPQGTSEPACVQVAAGLRGDGLEHLLRDVEVREDVLDVVVLLEGVDEPEHLLRRRLVGDLDGRLRHHRQLGRGDLDARLLDRLPHRDERL